jgi:multidrug efflux pump subunit AcrA (membrane-fusion protein)
LNDLNKARAAGLAINRSVQEMTSASLSATEHVASLQAEQRSLSAELDADRIALAQAASAYDELRATYADGVLYASAGGDIGASVAPVGQTLSMGSGGIAAIFTGESFVLAYVPDAYLFEVSEGQTVGVRARNEVLNGRIDRILPFAESLPSDLQAPNRMLERGRLMRIALIDPNQFPVDQRVQVTTCFLTDCHVGVFQASLRHCQVGSFGRAVAGCGHDDIAEPVSRLPVPARGHRACGLALSLLQPELARC